MPRAYHFPVDHSTGDLMDKELQPMSVSFANCELAPFMLKTGTFPGHAIKINYIGDRYRVIRVVQDKYLIFYGESESIERDAVPAMPIKNQLRAADDGAVRKVDGKKYTISGFNEEARLQRP
jgi:hypothetical protein